MSGSKTRRTPPVIRDQREFGAPSTVRPGISAAPLVHAIGGSRSAFDFTLNRAYSWADDARPHQLQPRLASRLPNGARITIRRRQSTPLHASV
jgi:hypothetical protein